MIVGIVVGAFAVICLAEAVVIAVVICVRRGYVIMTHVNTGLQQNENHKVILRHTFE